MIAVAIIAIAFTVLLGSQSQGLSLANESRFKTTASLLAQGKIAEIEAQAEAGEIGSGSGDFGEAFPDYAWDLSVTDVSFPGAEQLAERLKRIDLEITWAPDNQYRYRLRLYKFL